MAADKTELRGMCDTALAHALDALAMASDMDRNSYINHVLASHVQAEARKASLLVRVLKGNPFMAECDRKGCGR